MQLFWSALIEQSTICLELSVRKLLLSVNGNLHNCFRLWQFFVYLHEKHTKILDSNLEKQGRIVKSRKKRKHMYIRKDNEITIYFSPCIHD